jgi:hypothetical protein
MEHIYSREHIGWEQHCLGGAPAKDRRAGRAVRRVVLAGRARQRAALRRRARTQGAIAAVFPMVLRRGTYL